MGYAQGWLWEKIPYDYDRTTKMVTGYTMQEELASLGTSLGEQNFSAIILGSLSKSYD
jgi:hypothetical protein